MFCVVPWRECGRGWIEVHAAEPNPECMRFIPHDLLCGDRCCIPCCWKSKHTPYHAFMYNPPSGRRMDVVADRSWNDEEELAAHPSLGSFEKGCDERCGHANGNRTRRNEHSRVRQPPSTTCAPPPFPAEGRLVADGVDGQLWCRLRVVRCRFVGGEWLVFGLGFGLGLRFVQLIRRITSVTGALCRGSTSKFSLRVIG